MSDPMPGGDQVDLRRAACRFGLFVILGVVFFLAYGLLVKGTP
ncbi:MAG TPA: hypothetical protein VHG53_07610 [Candidatus Limnocylindria bacterium]|nr:hypothetical protein [Candidatus Limnocylindria bacterium]